MELRHLRYFIAVAEKENMTRAAAQLHVSQPPLSRQIRALEDELGVALFNHGAKAVRLTEAGKVFLAEARAVVERANEAVQIVKAVAGGKRGEIHVGYVSALSTEILPRALRLFQEANPYVRVQLHDMSMQEVLQGLSEEKLNVALVEQVPRKLMTGLTFEELHRDPASRARTPDWLRRSQLSRLSRLARRLVRATETRAPVRGRVRQRHQRYGRCRSRPRRGFGDTKLHSMGWSKIESSSAHTGPARPHLRYCVSQRR